MNIEIANRLYAFRKKHHLSQEELAEKIGVSRQAVSKWERAEASPDTDNLILLAKVYGVTLDELLMGTEKADRDNSESNTEKVHISLQDGIHVESKDGEKVHISWDGISVSDKNGGDTIGIEDGHIFKNGEDLGTRWEKFKKENIWYLFPYPILATIGFLLWGFLGGWHISWILFLTVPLYYSLVEAIYKRKPQQFAYPVLVTVVYLWVGIQRGLWHPTWILFVTIPIYYGFCDMVKKGRRKDRPSVDIQMDDNNGVDDE